MSQRVCQVATPEQRPMYLKGNSVRVLPATSERDERAFGSVNNVLHYTKSEPMSVGALLIKLCSRRPMSSRRQT